MTAGKGVVHSEIGAPTTRRIANCRHAIVGRFTRVVKGMQASLQRLEEFDEIPEAVEQDGKLRIKVISGKAYGVESLKDLAYTPVQYYYYTMKPGATFKQEMPKDFNFFLYVREGNTLVVNGDTKVEKHHNCFFNMDGDGITGENPASSTEDVEFVLVGGKTLNQEVFQYGPFVATSEHRIAAGLLRLQICS